MCRIVSAAALLLLDSCRETQSPAAAFLPTEPTLYRMLGFELYAAKALRDKLHL